MSKFDEEFNFNLIKKYEVSEILNILESFNDEWLINTHRQNQLDKTHQYTQSFFVKITVGNWQIGKKLATVNVCKNKKLLELTLPIIKDLEEYHNGKAATVMYVKLLPEKNISSHKDSGDYLENVRRHHIPIKTNNLVSFNVGDESINMTAGECWEINNIKTHFVVNDGNEERIHLIVDILPNTSIV
jgi:aspartyl/asparaginyl beta-hydroxylase (cupin superfamily)